MDERTDHEPAPVRAVARAPEVGSPTESVRATLTRVEVPARVHEPATAWCRHEVRRLVAGQLLGTAAIAASVVVAAMRWQSVEWAGALALGMLAGLVAATARVITVIVAGPLGMRYLRRYAAAPPEYVRTIAPSTTPTSGARPLGDQGALPDVWDLDGADVAPDGTPGVRPAIGDRRRQPGVASEVVGEPTSAPTVDLGDDPASADERSPRATAAVVALHEMGLSAVAAVRTDGWPSSVVELFSDGDRIVAAVDRTSGSVTLLTELVGFRVLVTSALLVPPTDELVVNVVDDDAPSSLVVSHRRLVHVAVRSRALASDPVGLFKLAQQREVEAYRQLGPFWSAMLDLRCRPGGGRLLSAPTAPDVLLFTGNRLFQQTG